MSSEHAAWPAVHITVETPAIEAIEWALTNVGALGTEINLLGHRSSPPDTTIVGYFIEKPDRELFRAAMVDALRIYGFDGNVVKRFEWTHVEDRDWLAEWKRHWRPVEVGKFIIAPPWADVAPTEKLIIRIEPNMAFGTGTHETTRLCIETISELHRPGQSFMDVGTGTGILAIAAAKLSATNRAPIMACDTDADSIRIARDNATANGVGEFIEFRTGSISGGSQSFDFTCANLTLDVIIPILPILLAITGRVLVLSGILLEQKSMIENELAKFEIYNPNVETAGEWISITVFLDRAS
ncbi:MAG TPA: 50S ribosomal protein L11 methyltransferase [Pyrinomonadaceae bacterium]|nr:50S ribosomal protein L11 methyltransferase [Pyrinomonadaceae bacterium]